MKATFLRYDYLRDSGEVKLQRGEEVQVARAGLVEVVMGLKVAREGMRNRKRTSDCMSGKYIVTEQI